MKKLFYILSLCLPLMATGQSVNDIQLPQWATSPTGWHNRTITPSSGGALTWSGSVFNFTSYLPLAGGTISGDLDLAVTSDSSHGVITQNGTSLIHTYGTHNYFAGSGAGNFTLTSADNAAIGFGALTADTSGQRNTALGSLTLNTVTTGAHNTGIGYNALGNLISGSGNIALGDSAGNQFTGSETSNIDIGNVGVAAEAGIIRIGTAGTHTDTYLTGVIHGNGSSLTSLPAAAAGTLTGATLASNVLASSLTSTGTLTGGATGAGFTVALSTSTITGTLADARLSANVALLNGTTSFTSAQTLSFPGITTSSTTDALLLQNTTASTSGTTIQNSPMLHWLGHVYTTTGTTDQEFDWLAGPVGNVTQAFNGVSTWKLQSKLAGGSYSTYISVGQGNYSDSDVILGSTAAEWGAGAIKFQNFYGSCTWQGGGSGLWLGTNVIGVTNSVFGVGSTNGGSTGILFQTNESANAAASNNILAIRQGTSSQDVRVYNTYTARGSGTTNLEALRVQGVASANFRIATVTGSTNNVSRGIDFAVNDSDANGTITNGPTEAHVGVNGLAFDNTGTASATAGAATLSKQCGVITTEALTTAAGSDYTLTLTNSLIASTSCVLATIGNGTNTTSSVWLSTVTPGSGSVVIVVHNGMTATALNGTLKVSFLITNP